MDGDYTFGEAGGRGLGRNTGPNPSEFVKNATNVRLPKTTRVKNKAPAPVQITAEQIVREAKDFQEEDFRAPKSKITDPEELAEYRLRKRKHYEDLVRRVKWNIGVWVKYAHWEESQKDLQRARSVWERALDVEPRNVSLYLKYAEMEMRNKNVNHARNVWDRAVTLLPRIDQLWYKYIHMEEILGNVAGARNIFERWMQWEPDHNGWTAYIKLELRYNEFQRARELYERYVACHPTVTAWVRYAKFEVKNGERARARKVYERAVELLGQEDDVEELYIMFAKFEEHCSEYERARCIYKYALDSIPKGQAEDLYRTFVAFEKQHGDKGGIENVIVSKRRFQYEDEIRKNPRNYDVWFDYIRLEESYGDKDKVREVYERAIANVPPQHTEKRYWQRYIYLWINYAFYEELEAEDVERTREVYTECLKLVPHKYFSFSKLWLLAAKFELRQKNLVSMRKILGMAIGVAPKEKIFKAYIEIELQLGNIDRCRTLYEKYLEWAPQSCQAWCKFAELEASLDETERVRALYELAISQPVLDMPEILWKAYIDFEMTEGEYENVRQLYERLLERTKHVKVWLSYGQFEQSLAPAQEAEEELDRDKMRERAECGARARKVFERAEKVMKDGGPDAKEERVMVLEAWQQCEQDLDPAKAQAVEKKMPRRVKRKRPMFAEDGQAAGFEEYYDYIFPDETGAAPNLKILEAAYRWKKQKLDDEGGAAETPEDN
mmetsp:Transcript_7023/g.25892  ORF Transcript_7023/g.25892 Transcript_7023/m.25892 type:complete len:723 (+) Transcript_7023:146-2314(+)